MHPLDFPVPRPLALCADPDVIGAIFYVMELAHGRPYANGALPEFDPPTRRSIYEQLVDTLADLHNIDPATAELGDFGKPGNYFERQVMRWTRQYRDSETDYIPQMERLISFLPETLPEQSRTAIVHGDYRIDNVVFDGDGTLTAVLDWELATLGDPLADFSYLAMQWMMPADGGAGLGGLDLAALGIPGLDEIAERYSARSGVPVANRLDWYFAYNLFRLTGIVQGIKKRVLDGTASHAEAAEMAKRVPMLAEAAWSFAQKAGGLEPAEQQQDYDDDQDQAEESRRTVAPAAAVAPARQCADQEQDHEDNQDGAKHTRLLIGYSAGVTVRPLESCRLSVR